MAMNKWVPESSPRILRRIGKTAEEASELTKVCARIIIQGVDGVDPANGKPNLQALTEELADMQAQINCCVVALGLDARAMVDRTQRKQDQMEEWEALFPDEPATTSAQGEQAVECPNGLLPDGPICPRCGEKRGPSGIDGGSWVHYPKAQQASAQPTQAAKDVLDALMNYVAVIATAGGGDKALFMAAIREADDTARAAISRATGEQP